MKGSALGDDRIVVVGDVDARKVEMSAIVLASGGTASLLGIWVWSRGPHREQHTADYAEYTTPQGCHCRQSYAVITERLCAPRPHGRLPDQMELGGSRGSKTLPGDRGTYGTAH
jgi:hypothetical protein